MSDKEERLNDLVPPETIIRYQVKLIKKEKEKNRKLKFRLGQSDSYIDELEDTISKLKLQIDNLKCHREEFSKEVKQEEMYNSLKGKLADYKKLNKNLKDSRDQISFLCTKYEKILKEHNLI